METKRFYQLLHGESDPIPNLHVGPIDGTGDVSTLKLPLRIQFTRLLSYRNDKQHMSNDFNVSAKLCYILK